MEGVLCAFMFMLTEVVLSALELRLMPLKVVAGLNAFGGLTKPCFLETWGRLLTYEFENEFIFDFDPIEEQLLTGVWCPAALECL